MAVDYATLKKGGFMRQKQKNNFSLRLRVVGGNLTAKQLAKIAEVAIAGLLSGMMQWIKPPKREAPSRNIDSSSSRGTLSKKPR